MFLSVAPIHTLDGALTLGRVEKTSDLRLPGGGEPISGDLADRWGWLHPGREWRNLGVSPQFDVAAELASRMWVASGHEPVDGVLAMDVAALRGVLAATGPISGPKGPIDEHNVERYLLHDQYLVADPNSPERQENLGAVAGAALQAVQREGVDVLALGTELAKAADGRHVMVWSADAAVERQWVAAGAAGVVQGDTMLVSLLNRGGNKLDWFVDMRNAVEIRRRGPKTDVSVKVTLTNHTPSGEPPYIAGPGEGTEGPPGRYIGLLAANVPGNAGRVGIDSLSEYAVAGRDGSTLVVAAPVTVEAGETKEFMIHFELAGAHRSIDVLSSARVPAVPWQMGSGTFRDDAKRVLAW